MSRYSETFDWEKIMEGDTIIGLKQASKAMTDIGSVSGKRCALVTGGGKGIGFEICRKLAEKEIRVILTDKNQKDAIEAVEKLKLSGNLDVVFHQLDVKDSASIAALANYVKSNFGKLDILVNNAGVSGQVIAKPQELRSFKDGAGFDYKENNFKANGWPIVVPAYKISKAAINAYTRLLARKFPNMLINCVHPGYFQTYITSKTGPYTPEEGARGHAMVALLPDDGPSGIFFSDMQPSTF